MLTNDLPNFVPRMRPQVVGGHSATLKDFCCMRCEYGLGVRVRGRSYGKDEQPPISVYLQRVIGDIEVSHTVDGQGTRETKHVKIFDHGPIPWEQAAIALGPYSILLSQDHVDDRVGQRVANAQDPVVVRVGQPQELSVSHGRDSVDGGSDSD